MDRIDQIICAELPNPETDTDNSPKDIVISQMIHGPFGPSFPKTPCMAKSDQSTALKCCKNYPRGFQRTAMVQEDGYTIYISSLHRWTHLGGFIRWRPGFCIGIIVGLYHITPILHGVTKLT